MRFCSIFMCLICVLVAKSSIATYVDADTYCTNLTQEATAIRYWCPSNFDNDLNTPTRDCHIFGNSDCQWMEFNQKMCGTSPLILIGLFGMTHLSCRQFNLNYFVETMKEMATNRRQENTYLCQLDMDKENRPYLSGNRGEIFNAYCKYNKTSHHGTWSAIDLNWCWSGYIWVSGGKLQCHQHAIPSSL